MAEKTTAYYNNEGNTFQEIMKELLKTILEAPQKH